jgi:hypothetical protein
MSILSNVTLTRVSESFAMSSRNSFLFAETKKYPTIQKNRRTAKKPDISL